MRLLLRGSSSAVEGGANSNHSNIWVTMLVIYLFTVFPEETPLELAPSLYLVTPTALGLWPSPPITRKELAEEFLGTAPLLSHTGGDALLSPGRLERLPLWAGLGEGQFAPCWDRSMIEFGAERVLLVEGALDLAEEENNSWYEAKVE